jgi:hypothetical protein
MIGMPTMLDLAKQLGNDAAVGLIEENIQINPEVRTFPARGIKGTSYKTLIRTGYPTAQFRNINEGVPRSKSVFENRLVEAFVLDTQIAADKALADVWDGGVAAYQAIESVGVTEAVLRRVSKSIYYGNSAASVAAGLGDVKGFPGFVDAYDTAAHEVDAGGSTALTSVWAVKLGIKDVHLVNAGGNVLGILPEWRIQSVADASNNFFTAYVNSLMGWIGMQVGSIHSLVRIKKVGTDAGKGMTDALGQQAIELFPSGVMPDFFIMNRRSRRQLHQSRTIVTATGGFLANNLPLPTDIEGVPLLITDSISNAEGTL